MKVTHGIKVPSCAVASLPSEYRISSSQLVRKKWAGNYSLAAIVKMLALTLMAGNLD